jgi:N-methylhydantoinase B
MSPHLVVAGDDVEPEDAGGGRCGDPPERDPEHVLRDVLRGSITAEDAARDYRVAVSGDLPAIDRSARDRLRPHGRDTLLRMADPSGPARP